ncbi:MAG: L-glutamine---4-(methylsulfanyl)-2-oxobutanoate aminotransferase [Solirubrobacteraceae bacterium]|nr:L-glutamine---4-(methylsulfanyl)-2-oxobutanoate aminotransferase [Solirubrobacteraceae bacterium]
MRGDAGRTDPVDGGGRPGPPPLFERLPEQFFTGILAAAAAVRDAPGPPLVDFGRGNPDLMPPPHAIEALREATLELSSPVVHGYPPFQGHRDLRVAIAERYRADHGVELDPDREVAVVPGTKTGIMLATLAAAGPRDGVLLPDPGYPDYRSAVALAGAREVPLGLDASAGHQPDFDAVPAAERDGARLLVLNYPSNPCAVLAAPGTLERAVEFAHAHGCWLLNDLAYGFLAFDGRRARSVLEVEGARDVAVELWSPSKIYGMAGWRIGFAVGSAEIVGRIKALIDHATAGVFTGLQRGLIAALRGEQDHVSARREVYRLRRDALVVALRAAGSDIAVPEGTFYAWWRLPEGLTAERLLREHRVAVAPGEGFGAGGAGWARLSLALADDQIGEGARRLAAAVAGALSEAAAGAPSR